MLIGFSLFSEERKVSFNSASTHVSMGIVSLLYFLTFGNKSNLNTMMKVLNLSIVGVVKVDISFFLFIIIYNGIIITCCLSYC